MNHLAPCARQHASTRSTPAQASATTDTPPRDTATAMSEIATERLAADPATALVASALDVSMRVTAATASCAAAPPKYATEDSATSTDSHGKM